MFCRDPGAHARKEPALRLAAIPDEAWRAGFNDGNRHGTGIRPTRTAMPAAIRADAFCATLLHEGEARGYGLAMIERGCVGLFDILVEERLRGRGLGCRLVAGMLDEALRRGAGASYLQVPETNAAAIGLHRRLSLSDSYGYAYRIPTA